MSVIFLIILLIFLILSDCFQMDHKNDLSKMYFGILIEDHHNFSEHFIRESLFRYLEEYMPIQDPQRYDILYISLTNYRNFSDTFLKHCCDLFERKILVAILMFGDTSTTFISSFLAKYLQVPVLWARNSDIGFSVDPYITDKKSFEVHLAPSPQELLKALRNFLIQTHWFTFSLITDDSAISSSLLNKEIWSILDSKPLNPTKLLLPSSTTADSFSSALSSIATSTRGIVVLMCDYRMAIKVLNEAKKRHLINDNFIWIWIETKVVSSNNSFNNFPIGILQIKPLPIQITRNFVENTLKIAVQTLRNLFDEHPEFQSNAISMDFEISCWENNSYFARNRLSRFFKSELEKILLNEISNNSIEIAFQVSNLVSGNYFSSRGIYSFNVNKACKSDISRKGRRANRIWRKIGQISRNQVQLNTIIWPGGNIVTSSVSKQIQTIFRVVTALAPPFVMESTPDEDGQCLRGLPCYRPSTSDKDNLTLIFHDKLAINCCYGLSMDLLDNVARELDFKFHLYIVSDRLFGSRTYQSSKQSRQIRPFRHDSVFKTKYDFRSNFSFSAANYSHFRDEFDTEAVWNGVIADLISGAAHMSFTALSVTSIRSQVIDFSVPYFYGGISFLASPTQKSGIPLMAFLLPFSIELWIAIFTSLNITAVAVAVYEWLSPFGLNPWGRQRSKNFSLSSALWVMWGLLCGHLVAFKAPKSWPNKFLINVWGGFSVIFIASYTANIAALIAGSFFHNTVGDYHDQSLLNQKIGAPKSSSTEWYVQNSNKILWEHMKHYRLEDIREGIDRLKNRTLDVLIADKPILNYYQATDSGCKLKTIGEVVSEDAYAIGMTKGFPLKDSISSIIAKYSSNGYMDILQEKWYADLACFNMDIEISQPRPLGIAAVTGVFLLLILGMVLGFIILVSEHMFYKFLLPKLRHKPKESIWRSRNIMFFSQKLYRFINCVELVSPHHAAKELVNTLRQGQITSLFQKSVKRKEHEQTRRRRSKAQFFEMIQTIRRQQQEEKKRPGSSLNDANIEYIQNTRRKSHFSPNLLQRHFIRTKHDLYSKTLSPNPLEKSINGRPKHKNRAKSIQNLRRLSNEINKFSPLSALNLNRKSSRDKQLIDSNPSESRTNTPSPVRSIDIAILSRENRSPVLSIENLSLNDCSTDFKSYVKQENIGKKLACSPKTSSVVSNILPCPTIQISVPEDSNKQLLSLSTFEKLSSNELQTLLNSNDVELRELILKAFQTKLSENQT